MWIGIRRWSFRMAAALSLGIGVFASFLWARSYTWNESIRHKSYLWHEHYLVLRRVGITSGQGGIRFFRNTAVLRAREGLVRTARNDPYVGLIWHRHIDSTKYYPIWQHNRIVLSKWNQWGFQFDSSSRPSGTPYGEHTNLSLTLPHWAVISPCLVLPAVAMVRLGRFLRRRRQGLCLHCGYDLRATPERCPECGTVVRATTP
jgi:hypothetical protein